MKFSGETIPNRDSGILSQLLDYLLPKTPVFDPVIHPSQNPGGILHRLLITNLAAGGTEVGNQSPLVKGRHFKRAPGPSGSLLKYQSDIFSGQSRLLCPFIFGLLQLNR